MYNNYNYIIYIFDSWLVLRSQELDNSSTYKHNTIELNDVSSSSVEDWCVDANDWDK